MNWAVFQIGAREHYAIPRALRIAGRSVSLTTDVWVPPEQSAWVPQAWKGRWHPELADVPVQSWNLSAAALEAREKMVRRGMWPQILRRNAWFGRKAAAVFSRDLQRANEPPVVFAYSYAAKQIFEIAKQAGCRCILGQIDPGPGEVRLVAELAKKYGDPDFASPPDCYWESWRAECELADRIVVNSAWSQELLRQELGNDEKIEVIPLAYEPGPNKSNARVANGKQDDLYGVVTHFDRQRPLRILYLGQVILRKGVKELAEAARRMADDSVNWAIIGNGPAHLLEELRNCPNTEVIGGVARNQVADRYRKSDVFLLPTHSDGYALTQLEAAAFGLPIIASQHCGQVVDNGINGILLAEVSAEAIVSSVRELLNNPTQLATMRCNQLQRLHYTLADLGAALTGLEIEKPQLKKSRSC